MSLADALAGGLLVLIIGYAVGRAHQRRPGRLPPLYLRGGRGWSPASAKGLWYCELYEGGRVFGGWGRTRPGARLACANDRHRYLRASR